MTRFNFAVLVVLSVVTACTHDVAAAPAGLVFEGDRVTLNLERGDDYLLVPVRIGDADAGLFIIDTGFTFSAVDSALADELQLPTITGGKLSGTGGDAALTYRVVPSLTLGGPGGQANATRRAITALDMSQMWEALGARGIRGFIGGDLLRETPFTIDWRAATLTLHAARGFAPPPGAERHPLLAAGNWPLVRVSLEGHLSGLFVLDTGSSQGITLHPDYASASTHVLAARPAHRSRTVGVGGPTEMRKTTFAEAALLGARLTDVNVEYSRDRSASAGSGTAGLVGWELLRGFRLTFDYHGGWIWADRPGSEGDVAPARPAEWDAPGFSAAAGRDATGLTPLMRAARYGLSADVKRFLASGSDVSAASDTGGTALHEAARSGAPAIVELLLAAGAPLDVKARHDVTPLHVAARSGNPAVVAPLIKAGADQTASDVFGRTALIYAAERGGGPQVVAALLAAGADPNVWSPSGTALHAAVATGEVEMIRALLAAGADANAVAKGPATTAGVPPPLLIAAGFGRMAALALLLEHGADPNTVDSRGRSALHLAANKADPGLVRALLASGADASLRTDDGQTALEAASAAGALSTDIALALYDAAAARDGSDPP